MASARGRIGPYSLHLTSVRKALVPRREPYWGAPLARGRFVGLRKIDAQRATWIARMRDDTGRQHYRSVGWLSEAFDFDQAKAAAIEWFKAHDSGVRTDSVTVADACRQYVEDRRREKGVATAHDAEKRFERTVYGKEFGDLALAKLRTAHIKGWRDRLELSPSSANRTLATLKAALNLAVVHRLASPAVAQEWRDVRRLKGAGKRRDLYLDRKQRRALLDASSGAARDLLHAAILTGARAGELVSAIRSQFEPRTRSMRFTGKTGTRLVPLSQPALALFRRLARGKDMAARLLTRDDGKPWGHSDWDGLVRKAADAAKLPAGVCLYTLRHSFVTQAISAGMTTLDVARLVGTSVVMIEQHYGHLVASAARDRLSKVAML